MVPFHKDGVNVNLNGREEERYGYGIGGWYQQREN